AGQLGTTAAPPYTRPAIVTGTSYSDITAGGNFTCAIRVGELWCWGANGSGQLGDGTNTQRTVPTRIGTATDWTNVEAGGTHACGIRAGGQLWCWGENASGQVGDGTA